MKGTEVIRGFCFLYFVIFVVRGFYPVPHLFLVTMAKRTVIHGFV